MTPSESRSPPESREYLEDIMRQEVEDSQERRRIRAVRGQKKPRYKILGALLGILVIVIGLNVARVLTAPDPFTRAEEEASAMLTVYLVAQGVEAFRDSAGFLPTDLENLDLDEEGLVYTVQESGYVLEYQDGGVSASYRSGQSLTSFVAAVEVLEGGGGQ
jgi:hypothetical protein